MKGQWTPRSSSLFFCGCFVFSFSWMEYTYTYSSEGINARPPHKSSTVPSFLPLFFLPSLYFLYIFYLSSVRLLLYSIYKSIGWSFWIFVCADAHTAHRQLTPKFFGDPRWSSYFFYASNVSLWSAKNPPPGTSTRGAKTHLLEIDVLSISLFSVRFFLFECVRQTDTPDRERLQYGRRGTSTHRMGDIMMNKVQRRESEAQKAIHISVQQRPSVWQWRRKKEQV